MNKQVCRITGTLEFPEGVMPGEGGKSNELTIARNGQRQPVLRGTALAGVLRRGFPPDIARFWFGEAIDGEEEGNESRVRVVDGLLDVGRSSVSSRTHHMRNRHTGAVVVPGLFSMEQLPPGTTCPFWLYVNMCDVSESDCKQFLERLCSVLGMELAVGGNRNRGMGRARCQGGRLTIHRFDLSRSEDYADWMDTRYRDRQDLPVTGGETREVVSDSDFLTVTLTLGIPRGEDCLIADGSDMVPQETVAADGKEYWKIPGSSFRGLLRSWMTRLAVREGETIRDSHEQWDEQFSPDNPKEYKPDLVGWGFAEENSEERKKYVKDPGALNDPILNLFGSMYQRGRIHITDALSSRPMDRSRDIQERAHVAIDRFSGGANEGAFFTNHVLITSDLTFSVAIIIEKPQEKEIRWLVKTLRALHLGILSVGSSKSAGRLEIRSIEVSGQSAEMVNALAAEIN